MLLISWIGPRFRNVFRMRKWMQSIIFRGLLIWNKIKYNLIWNERFNKINLWPQRNIGKLFNNLIKILAVSIILDSAINKTWERTKILSRKLWNYRKVLRKIFNKWTKFLVLNIINFSILGISKVFRVLFLIRILNILIKRKTKIKRNYIFMIEQ